MLLRNERRIESQILQLVNNAVSVAGFIEIA
jgi:hypothetical protein